MRKPPAYYEDLAEKAEAAKDWTEAARQWQLARAASLGHTRRAGYERRAVECLARSTREGTPADSRPMRAEFAVCGACGDLGDCEHSRMYRGEGTTDA